MLHQNAESQKTCSQGRPGADPGNVSAFPPPVPHLWERGGGGGVGLGSWSGQSFGGFMEVSVVKLQGAEW